MKLKINDKCNVISDWLSSTAKTRRVQVIGFQTNGNQRFVKVMWLGKEARENQETYGILFPVHELKKVA